MSKFAELEAEEEAVTAQLTELMMKLPNIIDASVPIGKNDEENVEVQRYGEPVVPDFEIPYHTEIMESFCGIDLDSARRVAGNGFYYLMGNIKYSVDLVVYHLYAFISSCVFLVTI